MAKQVFEFSIRRTTLDDVESLRRMQAQSWRDTYPNEMEGVSAEWVAQKTDAWLTPEGIARTHTHLKEVLVSSNCFHRVAVTPSGDVIGFIHATKENECGHVGALYVAEMYHGAGVARMLMELADDWLGDVEVDLEVASYNDRAKAFYRKYGYIETGAEPVLYENTIPIVRMVRKKVSL